MWNEADRAKVMPRNRRITKRKEKKRGLLH
jgi:hypothetical protein